MPKNKIIYVPVIFGVILLFVLASLTGTEALALVPVLAIGCWLIWMLTREKEDH